MKLVIQKFLLATVFALYFSMSYAQSNYRPGFIITLQNDTVFGQIDFRTDKMNAKRCAFKSDINSEIISYQPFDIKGYRFTDDGKYYVSRTIELTRHEPAQAIFLEYLLKALKVFIIMKLMMIIQFIL